MFSESHAWTGFLCIPANVLDSEGDAMGCLLISHRVHLPRSWSRPSVVSRTRIPTRLQPVPRKTLYGGVDCCVETKRKEIPRWKNSWVNGPQEQRCECSNCAMPYRWQLSVRMWLADKFAQDNIASTSQCIFRLRVIYNYSSYFCYYLSRFVDWFCKRTMQWICISNDFLLIDILI